jgi:tRNA-splicing ligase RtcB
VSEVGRTKIVKETPYRFRIEQEGAMRVPGIVFASRSLLPDEHEDMALAQVANVATLPGIVRASYAMPDVHWGYGFPIGGVAATDIDADGVVSPGGVGFDISCGVRLLVSRVLDRDRLQPRIRAVMDHLDVAIPRGVGTKGVWRLPNRGVLKQVLAGGARFAVEQGHGVARDVKRCEDGGVLEGADPPRSATGRSNAGLRRSAAWARATTSSKCRPWTGSTTRSWPGTWDCPRAGSV